MHCDRYASYAYNHCESGAENEHIFPPKSVADGAFRLVSGDVPCTHITQQTNFQTVSLEFGVKELLLLVSNSHPLDDKDRLVDHLNCVW